MTVDVHRKTAAAVVLLSCAFVAGCGVSYPPTVDTSDRAHQHVAAFGGLDIRNEAPGGPGERGAIEYARAYLTSLGLQTSLQSTPLISMVPTRWSVTVRRSGGAVADSDARGDHFLVWPGHQDDQVTVSAGIVFAAYGIVSPEYNRDDYKDVDVRDKIVLVLEGTPRTLDRSDLGLLGETYYGSRQYKFAEAARRGAAGVLIVHDDREESWADIRATSAGTVLDIDRRASGHADEPRAQVEGWISQPAARRLFELAAVDVTATLARARELAFRPIPLPGLEISIDLLSRFVTHTTNDVFAVLPGETPEYVMLAGRWNRLDADAWAHLDDETALVAETHLPDDDGSGAAVVLEAARRLVATGTRPKRGIVIMVATAHKPGLLGLEYFTEQPPASLPLDQMTALIFMDHADLQGTSSRVGKIGSNADEALSQLAREAAVEQGRLFELDGDRNKHFYYTFGQAELGRDGVRTIFLTSRPQEDGTNRMLRDLARRDHMVGLVKAPPAGPWHDPALLANIALRAAGATNWPPRIEAIAPRR